MGVSQKSGISPYCRTSFDDSFKDKLPGNLFFIYQKRVPLYCTYVVCTQGCHNISLIEDEV